MKMLDLTNEELCRLAQSGDNAARDKLIENNIGFIKTTASEAFQKYGDKLGITFDDFVQSGMIALWKCINKFEKHTDATFLTYARQAIKNSMTDTARKSISVARSESVSLEECSEDGEQKLLSAWADAYNSNSPERVLMSKETIRELYNSLMRLSGREREYLIYRFGFKDGIAHTAADTASHFSLSTSRGKSVESAAINKLREMMGV